MATQLWLRQANPPTTRSLGGTAYDYPRFTTIGDDTRGPAVRNLLTAVGASINSRSATTFAGPLGSPGAVVNEASLTPCVWTTDPLAADVTISGTITFNVWMSESSMNANAGSEVVIQRHQPDGTVTTIIDSEKGTELGTSAAAQNWTGTPTSTACKVGDRIVVIVYINDAGGTMASGFSANLRFNDSAANTAESYVTLTENLTFQTTDPAGTVINLLDDASDVSGSGKKRAWTDAVSGVVSYVTNTVASTSFADAQVTDSAGGTALEWYTPQLEAVTLDDLVKVSLYGVESNASANASWRLDIYKTAADGSGATIVFTASASQETPTADGYVRFFGGINTSLTQGQRLLFRVYQTSQGLGSPGASGFTVTLKVEDNTNPSTITFTETLVEKAAAPGPPLLKRGRTIRKQALLVRGGF